MSVGWKNRGVTGAYRLRGDQGGDDQGSEHQAEQRIGTVHTVLSCEGQRLGRVEGDDRLREREGATLLR